VSERQRRPTLDDNNVGRITISMKPTERRIQTVVRTLGVVHGVPLLLLVGVAITSFFAGTLFTVHSGFAHCASDGDHLDVKIEELVQKRVLGRSSVCICVLIVYTSLSLCIMLIFFRVSVPRMIVCTERDGYEYAWKADWYRIMVVFVHLFLVCLFMFLATTTNMTISVDIFLFPPHQSYKHPYPTAYQLEIRLLSMELNISRTIRQHSKRPRRYTFQKLLLGMQWVWHGRPR
jgi:hypothetical protein